jgi:hypothetical protein
VLVASSGASTRSGTEPNENGGSASIVFKHGRYARRLHGEAQKDATFSVSSRDYSERSGSQHRPRSRLQPAPDHAAHSSRHVERSIAYQIVSATLYPEHHHSPLVLICREEPVMFRCDADQPCSAHKASAAHTNGPDWNPAWSAQVLSVGDLDLAWPQNSSGQPVTIAELIDNTAQTLPPSGCLPGWPVHQRLDQRSRFIRAALCVWALEASNGSWICRA